MANNRAFERTNVKKECAVHGRMQRREREGPADARFCALNESWQDNPVHHESYDRLPLQFNEVRLLTREHRKGYYQDPPVGNGEYQRGAYRDPHVLVQREVCRHRQPQHVPAPGRRKDDQETQSDSRRVPAQSSCPVHGRMQRREREGPADARFCALNESWQDNPVHHESYDRLPLQFNEVRLLTREHRKGYYQDPPVGNGEYQRGAYRDPHVLVQREGCRLRQPQHVPAPGRRKDDQETQSDSRRVPAQSRHVSTTELEKDWKKHVKHDASVEAIKNLLKEMDDEEKPPVISKAHKSATKLLEKGVKNGKMKINKQDNEMKNELLKIGYKNKARSIARNADDKTVLIEKAKEELAAVEEERTDTALQMVLAKIKEAKIKLHNEKREVFAQEKKNEIEESIKRR